MSAMLEKLKHLLSPPGNGVFTVHTAKEFKSTLHQALYKVSDTDEVKRIWEKSLVASLESPLPSLIAVPMDTGGGIQRGANWGPLFIRNELLNLHGVSVYNDLGDIRIIPHLLHDKYLNESTIKECQLALYAGEELPVSGLSMAELAYQLIYDFSPDKKLFGLGGDHSVSYSFVRQWLLHKKKQAKRVAVIHFDAHTDLLDQRLGIDICFGSWAYHMIELLHKPTDLIQFGIRSSGKDRNHWESKLKINQIWADEIHQNLQAVLDKTLDYLSQENIEEVYISFDIDALDLKYASCTGTPEKGGLEPHQCTYLIKGITTKTQMTGCDLVEVAPFVRSPYQTILSPEPQTTLANSALIAKCLLEALG